MELTVKILREWFSCFNTEYFDGRLPEPRLLVSRARTLMGQFRCKKIRKGWLRGSQLTDFTIQVSDFYDLSERDYQQTLLHEMIHYYIAYTSVRDTSAHGRLFRQEAARINHAGGWNITISERRRTLTVRKEHQRKQSLLLLLKTEDGKFYVSAVNPNYRTIIDRQARMAKVIEEYHWTVSGDSRYSTLPLSRSLRGRRISESEYLQIILNS